MRTWTRSSRDRGALPVPLGVLAVKSWPADHAPSGGSGQSQGASEIVAYATWAGVLTRHYRCPIAAGHAVVATARGADAVTAALGSHDELLAVQLDITDPSSVDAAIQAAVARFGRIDVLGAEGRIFQERPTGGSVPFDRRSPCFCEGSSIRP